MAARELQATLRVLPFDVHPETPPGGSPAVTARRAPFMTMSRAPEAAWQERRFRRAVDAFIREARLAGVNGVPAVAWPNQRAAIVGMMRPQDLVARLRDQTGSPAHRVSPIE